MTRLIDEILNAGATEDALSIGALSAMARAIAQLKPQCFEITDEVVQACMSVFKSRPSSILSALNYARLPYPAIWIERVFVPQIGPDMPNADKPPPKRVGCLIQDDPRTNAPPLSSALATWAWCFDPNKVLPPSLQRGGSSIHVAPFAVLFDWDQPLDQAMGLTPDAIQYIRDHKTARWHNYVNDPKEREAIQRLAKHNGLLPNPFSEGFWRDLNLPLMEGMQMPYSSINDPEITPIQRAILGSLIDDLAGEDVIVTAFLLMLNSRNAITRTREDLGKLNRARAKKQRRPLTEFIKTSLTLPKHLERAVGPNASEAERAAARAHMVRGHYKTRRSGVYWWSPHPRGRGRPVRRQSYSVRTEMRDDDDE